MRQLVMRSCVAALSAFGPGGFEVHVSLPQDCPSRADSNDDSHRSDQRLRDIDRPQRPIRSLGATRANDSRARRPSADERLPPMPGCGLNRTMRNAIKVSTDLKVGFEAPGNSV